MLVLSLKNRTDKGHSLGFTHQTCTVYSSTVVRYVQTNSGRLLKINSYSVHLATTSAPPPKIKFNVKGTVKVK